MRGIGNSLESHKIPPGLLALFLDSGRASFPIFYLVRGPGRGRGTEKGESDGDDLCVDVGWVGVGEE